VYHTHTGVNLLAESVFDIKTVDVEVISDETAIAISLACSCIQNLLMVLWHPWFRYNILAWEWIAGGQRHPLSPAWDIFASRHFPLLNRRRHGVEVNLLTLVFAAAAAADVFAFFLRLVRINFFIYTLNGMPISSNDEAALIALCRLMAAFRVASLFVEVGAMEIFLSLDLLTHAERMMSRTGALSAARFEVERRSVLGFVM
jgi:hypothetical protein